MVKLRKDTSGLYTKETGGGIWYHDDENVETALDSVSIESGFEDGDTEVDTLVFTNGTRQFDITPVGASFMFYSSGVRYVKTAVDSVVIADTEGLHFIYYNASGVLTETTTWSDDLITEYALVAIIYWDATNNLGLLLNELHGRKMSNATHLTVHKGIGTLYDNGLGLGNMTVDGDGSSDTHVQFSVADGVILDEDLEHNIVDDAPQDLTPTAYIQMFYRSGANGDWRWITATATPVTTTGSGRLAWNEFTGGEWQLTEIDNTKFVLVHYFAIPGETHKIIGVVGQAQYNTKAAAKEGAEGELTTLALGAMGEMSAEYIAVATCIFQTADAYTNSVNARILSTLDGSDYIDWRGSGVGSPVSSSAGDPTAIHADASGEIAALTEKGTPVSADNLMIEDSADGDSKKRVEISNLPAGTPADNSITNAKLADIDTATIKGRTTAGSGDPEDLTKTQTLAILNVDDGADVTIPITDELVAGASLVPGNWCYMGTGGKMLKTEANAYATVKGLVGLCLDTLADTETGTFQFFGPWTTTGLTAGSEYVLEVAAGTIATQGTLEAGEYQRKVGAAISTTELFVNTFNMTIVKVA